MLKCVRYFAGAVHVRLPMFAGCCETGETAIAKSDIKNFYAAKTNEISRQFEVSAKQT